MTIDHRPPADDRALFWEALANTFRPYAGWAFYGFGALFVLLGYLGIANESVVAKQLPYLISGGIGGILLALLGASFLGMEQLRADSDRLDRIEQQVAELHRVLLDRPDAPPVESLDAASAPADPAQANGHPRGTADDHPGLVTIVEAGETFHAPGCALVAGKAATSLEATTASAQGLRPCPVCEPAVTLA